MKVVLTRINLDSYWFSHLITSNSWVKRGVSLFIRSAPSVFPHETSPNQILLKTGRNAVRFALWPFETSFPPLLKTNIVVFPAIGHHFGTKQKTRCSLVWNKSAHSVIRRKETAVNLQFEDVSWPSFQALLAPPILLRSEPAVNNW